MKKPIQLFILLFTVNFFAIVVNTVSAQTTNMGILPEGSKIITGTVDDEQGMPIPGANVKVKNSAAPGVQTDFDGRFYISAKDDDMLVVTYPAMATQTITLCEKTNYKVVMEEIYATTGELDICHGPQYYSPQRAVCVLPKTEEKKRTFFGRIFHAIGNLFR